MDSQLAKSKNGVKINGWLHDLTFPKFLFTMIFFAVLFYARTETHLEDKNIHLDTQKEQVTMAILAEESISRGANLAVIELQHEIDAMKAILAKYEREGKLQTPEEKKELIREVIKEYNAKN